MKPGGTVPVCWGPDAAECERIAHEQVRWFGNGWKVDAHQTDFLDLAGKDLLTTLHAELRPADGPA